MNYKFTPHRWFFRWLPQVVNLEDPRQVFLTVFFAKFQNYIIISRSRKRFFKQNRSDKRNIFVLIRLLKKCLTFTKNYDRISAHERKPKRFWFELQGYIITWSSSFFHPKLLSLLLSTFFWKNTWLLQNTVVEYRQ